MKTIFTIRETQGNTIFDISMEDYLEEVNRERDEDWVDFTERDLTEENNYLKELFEEARYYELLKVINL